MATIEEYRKLLENDKDYDWIFLLELEQFKLKRMSKYFSESQITYDWEYVVSRINLCVKLIDIVLEKDTEGYIYDNSLKLPYVNTNNKERFPPVYENSKFGKNELRQTKALYLYNLIRTTNMRSWWD